ncbi:acyl-CoA-binding domain-containing protein 5 [Nephila pilipes]|uniref:Acyl-CoA-binding domain-containing protein 5 n=1 Tax=Nephila pilipes TaxID=299642 RepID=A0A8X6PZ25_NEPPI|nr:acyl-CoA-binding domain-containing protein 5 [Nephila pilipes]
MSTKERFLAAVDVINSIPYDGTFEPSQEMMLKLYAYEMQGTEGPCCEPKPYPWNLTARAKWNAWSSLGSMSKEVAMENYIEELTKVIETMSYNEKIAKFMSLMGPFYEEVSSYETDTQKEKGKWFEKSISSTISDNYNPPTILELYHMSRNVQETKTSFLDPSTVEISGNFEFPENLPESYSNSPSTSSSELSNFDLLSDLSDAESPPATERHHLHIFKNINAHHNCPFLTEKDLLVLTLMNLQSSMEGILEKLDNLHMLAESANLADLEMTNKHLECDNWSLNLSGTAFALLWPVVVDLCFNAFRK